MIHKYINFRTAGRYINGNQQPPQFMSKNVKPPHFWNRWEIGLPTPPLVDATAAVAAPAAAIVLALSAGAGVGLLSLASAQVRRILSLRQEKHAKSRTIAEGKLNSINASFQKPWMIIISQTRNIPLF